MIIVGGLGGAILIYFILSRSSSSGAATTSGTQTLTPAPTTGTGSGTGMGATNNALLQAILANQVAAATPVPNSGLWGTSPAILCSASGNPCGLAPTPAPKTVVPTPVPNTYQTGTGAITSTPTGAANYTTITGVTLPTLGVNPGGDSFFYTPAQENAIFAAGYNLSNAPKTLLSSIGA